MEKKLLRNIDLRLTKTTVRLPGITHTLQVLPSMNQHFLWINRSPGVFDKNRKFQDDILAKDCHS